MGNSGYKVNPNILFWIRLKSLQNSNNLNQILEIAYIYTDMKLTICQAGKHIVIHCSKETLEKVDQNQLELMKENGLYEACLKSQVKINDAEEMIMKEMEERNITRGQLLAAGKQAHLAKYVLMRHMPKLHDFLHYRIFDLSSVKLVVEGLNVNLNREEIKETLTQKAKQKINQEHQEISQVIGGKKRANQEVSQDIHQMQFYYQYALNDQ